MLDQQQLLDVTPEEEDQLLKAGYKPFTPPGAPAPRAQTPTPQTQTGSIRDYLPAFRDEMEERRLRMLGYAPYAPGADATLPEEPVPQQPEGRGWLGDIGSAIGRSGVRAVEGIGDQLGAVAELANVMGGTDAANTLETEAHKALGFGERLRSENAWLQPSKEEEGGFVRRGVMSGIENVGQSVTAALPVTAGAAIVGGVIGTLVAPGPGTAAGAWLGAKLGFIFGGGLAFGLSEYHNAMHEAVDQGVPLDKARAMAAKSGAIEALGETVGNVALGKMFGLFRPMGAAGVGAGSTAIKDIFKRPLREKFFALSTGMATEVGTEMGQEFGEALVRRQAGVTMGTDAQGKPIPYNEWSAAVEAIIPALTMTSIIGGGHSVMQRMNRQRNFRDLQNPEAPAADRFDAVSAIVADLVQTNKANEPMADMWAASALGRIMRKEAIPLDTSILEMTDAELTQMAAGITTQVSAAQREEVVAFAAAREEQLGRKRNLTPVETAEMLWLKGAQGNPDILTKVYSVQAAAPTGPADLTGTANPPAGPNGVPAPAEAVGGPTVDQTLPAATPETGVPTPNRTVTGVEPPETRDPLWDQVTQFITQGGQASVEAVRKVFNIGVARAGRLVNSVLLRLGQGAPAGEGEAAPGEAPLAGAPPPTLGPPAAPAGTGVVGGPAPPKRVRKPKAPAVVGGPAAPVAPPTVGDTLPPGPTQTVGAPVDLTGTANPLLPPAAPAAGPTANPSKVSLFRSSMEDFAGSPEGLFGSFTGEALEMVAGEPPSQLEADGLIERDPDTGHWKLTEAVRGPAPQGVGIPPVEGPTTLPGTPGTTTEQLPPTFTGTLPGGPMEVTNAEGTGRGPEEGGGATGIEGGGGGRLRLRDNEAAGLEAGAGEGQGIVQAPGQEGLGEVGTLPAGPAIEGGPAAPTAGATTLPGGIDLTRTGEPGPGGVPAAGPTGVPPAPGGRAIEGGPGQVRPEAPPVVGGPAPPYGPKGRQEVGESTQEVGVPILNAPGESLIDRELASMSEEDIDNLIEEVSARTGEAPTETGEAPAETGAAPTGTPTAPPVYGPRKGPRTVEGGPAATGAAKAISNAAKLGVTGIDEAMKGLYELFGKPGSTANVGVPVRISRETYEKAKPHFQASLTAFKASGRSVKEWATYMWDEISAWGDAAKEALKVFLLEAKSGQPYQWEDQTETPPVGGEEGTGERESIGEDEGAGPVGGPVEGGAAPGRGKKGKPAKGTMKGVENVGDVYDPYKRTLDEDAKDGGKRAINRIVDKLARPKAFHLTPAEGATPGTTRYMEHVRKGLKTFQEWVAKTLAGHSRWKNYGFMDSITNWVLDKSQDADTQQQRMASFTEAAAKYLAICDSINKAVAQAKDVTTAAAFLKDALYKGGVVQRGNENDLIYENRTMFDFIDRMVGEAIVAQFAQNEAEATVVIKPFDRIKNDVLLRTGLPERREGGRDATAQELMETFALEGVGYGQESYMTVDDRRKFTNWAYDSLHDMAELFKMPLKAIGWYGGLQLQFGNLGTMSSKAAAFFMPKDFRNQSKAGVINLTKTQGDGSVAHEFGHANDFNLRDNAPSRYDEVYQAMAALRDRFQFALDFEAAERWILEAFKPGSQTARDFATSYRYRGLKGLKLMRKVVEEKFEELVKIPSAFYKASNATGNAQYQTRETEMWARAFEAYVYDKLGEQQAVNNFLVNDYAAEGMVSPENGYRALIYPAGIERVQFNQAIDEFLDSLDWGDDATQMSARDRGEQPHPTWKEGRENALAKLRQQMDEEKVKLLARLEELYLMLYPGKPSNDGLYWYAYRITRRGMNMQPRGFWAYDDKVMTEEQGEGGGIGAVGYPEQLHPDHVETFKLSNFVHDVNDNKVYLKEGERDVDQIDEGSLEGTPPDYVPPVGGGGDAGQSGGDGGDAGAPGSGGAENVGVEPGSGEGVGDDDVPAPPVGGGRAQPPAGPPAIQRGNFVFTDLDAHRPDRSIAERFTANLAAIRVLKSLEAANRQPTADEKKALSYYSGWGGLGEAFNQYASKPAWRDRYDMLKEVLTENEMATLWDQNNVEYYTPIDYYRAIWDVLVHMGFEGGKVLGPAAGIGNEFGSVSPSLQGKVKLTGIEPSSVSFKIMKYLYNDTSSVMYNKKFEDVVLAKNFYDVVISNVPFADSHPADKVYNKEHFTIHNYMLRRALALTRPGGIVAVLTTPRSMDGQNAQRMRAAIQKEGGVLVAAFRIPQPFSQTDISPDVLFIQRKAEGTYEQKRPWLERKALTVKDKWGYNKEVQLNEWFTTEVDGALAVNPEFFLGTPTRQTLNYGTEIMGVALDPQHPPMEMMKAWVARNIPADIMRVKAAPPSQDNLTPAPADVLPGRYFDHENGELHIKNYDGTSTKFTARKEVQIPYPEGHKLTKKQQAEEKRKAEERARKLEAGEELTPEDEPGTMMMPEAEQIKRIRSLMKIRDALRGLIRVQSMSRDTKDYEFWQAELATAYDSHVANFGTVDSTAVVYEEDDDYPLVLITENKNEETEEVTRNEDIFTKAFLADLQPPTAADSAADAMMYSLAWKGHIDFGYMRELTGTPEEELIAELGDRIFNDPEQGWVTQDFYLSGNVKAKLAIVQELVKQDPAFERNVKALEAVIPPDKTITEFIPKLGGYWLPEKSIEDFANTLCDLTSTYGMTVRYAHSKELAKWTLTYNTSGYRRAATTNQMIRNAERDPKASGTYGLGLNGFSFYHLLLMALNGQTPTIMRDNPITGAREVDEVVTADARAKQLLIQDEFVRWARANNEAATKIEEAYNREVNNTVVWKPDGRHLTLSGKSAGVGLTRDPETGKMLALRPHQLNAIWRFLMKGNTYFCHDMGTGKTYTMIAAAMEARRLGLRRRPMIAVKNATLAQFARDAKRLYPMAKVLVLHVSKNHRENQKQLAKVVGHDWDLIIVPHSQFDFIRLSPDREATIIREDIQELKDYLIAARINPGQGAMGRHAENMLAQLALDLQKAEDSLKTYQQEMAEGKYPALHFDELGVDMLVVDEADAYKNIPFRTAFDGRGMSKTKGITGAGNAKALDYYWKTRFINQAHPGGIILGSGTIVNNSITELFNVQRAMQPQALKEAGLTQFDAWAAAFGRIEQMTATTPTGQGQETITTFKKFQNTLALGRMLYEFLDTVTSEQAGVIRPQLVTGKPISVTVRPNYLVKAFNALILRRLDRIKQMNRAATWALKVKPDGTIENIQDIVPRLVMDGSMNAIDPRFLEPAAPDLPDSKINEVVRRVLYHYKHPPAQDNPFNDEPEAGREAVDPEVVTQTYTDPYNGQYNGVQIVFIDKGQDIHIPELDPSEVGVLPDVYRDLYLQRMGLDSDKRSVQFNVHEDIIAKLVAGGIPRHEITTIWEQEEGGGSDREKAKRKIEFQNKMNRGKIRVLIASTKKGGIGYNFQKRIVAMHHVDMWWHFANFLQASARGHRHGNINKYVYNYVYVVPDTVDRFIWDTVQRKSKVFDAIYSGDLMSRDEWEDVSQESMSAVEIAAQASGNPLIKERADLDKEITDLSREHQAWLDNRRRAQIALNQSAANIRSAELRAASYEQTIAALEGITGVRLFTGGGQSQVFRLKDQGGEIKAALDKIEATERPKLIALAADINNRVSIGQVGAVEKVEGPKGQKATFTMLGDPAPMQLFLYHSFAPTRQLSLGIAHKQRDLHAIYSELDQKTSKLEITGNLSRLITSRIDSLTELATAARAEAEQVRKQIPVNEQIAGSDFAKANRLREAMGRMEQIDTILSSVSSGSLANPEAGALFTFFKPTFVFVDDFGIFSGWQAQRYVEGFGSDTIVVRDNPKDQRQVKRGNFPKANERPANQSWELKTEWQRGIESGKFQESSEVAPLAFWQTGGGLGSLVFFNENTAVRSTDFTLAYQMAKGQPTFYTVRNAKSPDKKMVVVWQESDHGKRMIAMIKAVSAQEALDSHNSSLAPGADKRTELPDNLRKIFEEVAAGKTLQQIHDEQATTGPAARVGPPPGLDRLAQAEWWKRELERTHDGALWTQIDAAGLEDAVKELLAGRQPTPEMLAEREDIGDDGDSTDFGDDAGFATIDMLTFGLAGVVGDISNGLPHLIELGTHALKAGATTFRQFTDQMRAWLGELYEKFKPLMVKAYAQAKRLVIETEGSGPLNPIRTMREALAPAKPSEVAAATEGRPGRDVTPPDRAPFQYMGTMLYRPEQANPLTSATNTANPFDLGAARTTTPTMQSPHAGGGGLLSHIRGNKFLSKFLADIPMRDLRRWEELFSLPWYIAKRHPEFRPFIDIELNREEEKQEMTIDLTRSPNKVREGELHELLKLSEKRAAAVGKAIVDSDAQQVLLTNAQLTADYHLDAAQQAAYFAYWRSMQNAWKVKLAYANASIYWKYLDRPWMIPVSQWGAYREFKTEKGKLVTQNGQPVIITHTEGALGRLRMSDLQLVVEGFMPLREALARIPDQGGTEQQDKAEAAFTKAVEQAKAPSKKIRDFRRRWNKVKFYFPRLREQGDYVVRVWEGEDENRKAVYSERVYNTYEAQKVVNKLKAQYDEDQIEAVYAPVIPETIYGDLEEAAMERFITKVLGQMQHGDQLTEEQAGLIQLGLFEGIADELNKRGFGMHAVPRRENLIEGYKTDDVPKIFRTYMSGLSGFLTKRKAAFEFYRALNAMGKTEKATHSKTPHMFEYSRRYSRDVLYNTDRIDMISAKMRALAFAYYLAGNLKSAAVNFTQNYVVAIPELAKHTGSYGRAFAAYHRAMRDIRSDKTQKARLSADEFAALHEVINKGVTTDQYIREITARGEGAGEAYDKIIHAVALPFRWVEVKNRQAAFLAAYRTFMRKGLGHATSVEKAKTYVYDSHFLYGKANLPQAMRGPTMGSKALRTLYTFRSYTHSFLLGMFDNLTGLPGGRRNVATVAQSLAAILVLGGLPAEPWVDDILDAMERWLGYPVRAKMYAWLEGTGGEMLREFGESGLPGVVAGVDLSGSLKIGLPSFGVRGTQEAIYGVYGGMIDKGVRAFEAIQASDPMRAFEEASPSFVSNVFRAAREVERGVTTNTGRVKFDEQGKPMKLGPGEFLSRAVGFRQAREAHASMEMRSFDNLRTAKAADRDRLRSRWIAAETQADKTSVLRDVQQYNRSVLQYRGAIPKVTMQSLRQAKQTKPTKPYLRYQRLLDAGQ